MKKFELPKLWYVEGDNKNEDMKKIWNDFADSINDDGHYSFLTNFYYFLDNKGQPAHSRNLKPINFTQITHQQFIDHVVNKGVTKSSTQDSDYNEILIKLLKNE